VVGLVVVTHGRLASVLLETAAQVCGSVEAAAAIDVPATLAPPEISKRVLEAIAEVDRGQGVLVLVDLLGGTPWNRTAGLVGTRDVEVLAGVNLPMLLKFAVIRERGTPTELARELALYGRKHMEIASERIDGSGEREQ